MTPPRPMTLEALRLRCDESETGCWLWREHTTPVGYAQLTHQRKPLPAHRVTYELAKGPIPEGLHVDHLCRVRHCINPDHLEAVTPRENILRGEGRAALNARKTHCVNGHPFDEENTYVWRDKQRHCRICIRAAVARYRQRKQQEVAS